MAHEPSLGAAAVRRGGRAVARGEFAGPAERSREARCKDCTRATLEGRLPLQSLPDLLASLAPLTAVELMYRVRPDSTTQLIVGESWGQKMYFRPS